MHRAHLAAATALLCLIATAADAQDAVSELGSALEGFSRSLQEEGGESSALSGRIIQLVGLLSLLSVAPGLMIMVTSFTRFVIVFSMLRSALGLGQTPPNMVITSLAMFMTFFVMQPVFEDSWESGIAPLTQGSITEAQALSRIAEPFHRFMAKNVRDEDLALFARLAQADEEARATLPPPRAALEAGTAEVALPADQRAEIPWSTLVPAFMISELRRAFLIGFLIYIPFVAIDLIVSAILMAAGMMMLSPVMISLPFKVIFFVLIDGWYMLAGSLMQSYAGM
ncbi:flagellar type III secretion system pore protein FliP [Paracoccus ravus]|uniref:flagellar type III secretion system pore protein FliP n=1 Tax=Paracoccus ravus TaxID=2447760 RepID=UPI00106DE3D4|nr:flagellar type III secretion system pore protein FliP [Paracoccus ravus]